jgi:hypothetical protein
LILIGMIANAGEENGSRDPQPRSTQQSAQAAGAITATDCRRYATQLVAFSPRISDAMTAASEAAFAAAEGSASFDDAADVFTESAATFDQSSRLIRDLGTPPSQLASAVNLLLRALNTLSGAYEMAALGARTFDVDLITEANARIDDGTSLINQATSALEAC